MIKNNMHKLVEINILKYNSSDCQIDDTLGIFLSQFDNRCTYAYQNDQKKPKLLLKLSLFYGSSLKVP